MSLRQVYLAANSFANGIYFMIMSESSLGKHTGTRALLDDSSRSLLDAERGPYVYWRTSVQSVDPDLQQTLQEDPSENQIRTVQGILFSDNSLIWNTEGPRHEALCAGANESWDQVVGRIEVNQYGPIWGHKSNRDEIRVDGLSREVIEKLTPFVVKHFPADSNAKMKRSEERRVGKEGRSRWSPYH